MEGVLIDSGASCNLIDYETWNSLKQKHVKCESKQADKKLFAYGQKEPIEVAGTFVSEMCVKLLESDVWMELKSVQLQQKAVTLISVRDMQISSPELES